MPNQKHNFILYFFLGLLVILIFVWTTVFAEATRSQESLLRVTFFDVGQGDAIFIETPGGRQILIDGGPDNTVLKKLANVMSVYDRDIDIVIATHPDADHIAGLIEVLKKYNVQLVVDSGDRKDTDIYKAFLKAVKAEGRYMKVVRGDTIKIGEDIVISLLNPSRDLRSKSNDNSVVARLDYRANSFLFTGDIERVVEHELLARRENLDVDVLQLPHHGSKTSSSRLFLEQASPQIAVISVGRDNRYDHPHLVTLESLLKYGITTLRTDERGDITILSNGEELFFP